MTVSKPQEGPQAGGLRARPLTICPSFRGMLRERTCLRRSCVYAMQIYCGCKGLSRFTVFFGGEIWACSGNLYQKDLPGVDYPLPEFT